MQSIPIKKIIILTVFIRTISICTLTSISYLNLIPCFDCSSHFKFNKFQSLIRWDTLHFFSIHSVQRKEQHFAFSPALFKLIIFFRNFLSHYFFNFQIHFLLLFSISFLATLFSIASSIILFYLTLEIFNSIEFARLTTILHVLSPSPGTQVVAYTEPFYAFFSFLTIYFHILLKKKSHHHQYNFNRFLFKLGLASLAALTTAFRSLGVLNAALWCFDFASFSSHLLFFHFNFNLNKINFWNVYLPIIRHGIETIIMTLITISPFLYDQWIGYERFCRIKPDHGDQNVSEITGMSSNGRATIRPWCSNTIPSIYNFVQSHYWGVGFLKYWTWNQFPLFILSFPVYLITIKSLINYYNWYFRDRWFFYYDKKIKTESKKNNSNSNKQLKEEKAEEEEGDVSEEKGKKYREFLTKKIETYVHIQLIMTLILILNSHVQIILRQASTMPIIWWGLADQIQFNWSSHPSSSSSSSTKQESKKKINHPEKNKKFTFLSHFFGFGFRFSFDFVTFYFFWLVFWWPISLILWAGFYPPA